MIYPLFRYPENSGQTQLYNAFMFDFKIDFNAFIVSL